MDEKGSSNQAIFGTILLIIGVLFLLKTTGIYDTSQLLTYIPSLFVLLGIWAFYKSNFKNLVGPFILILIFGIIQLETLGLLPGLSFADLWPLVLIIIGIGFLINRLGEPSSVESDTDKIDLLAIFGGSESNITSKSFLGGEITAIFGGVDLELRDSEIEDPPIEINAFVMFGGAEIKVPEEWSVKMDVFPFIGGASDERTRSKERKGGKRETDLIVKGFSAFGGVSVKD